MRRILPPLLRIIVALSGFCVVLSACGSPTEPATPPSTTAPSTGPSPTANPRVEFRAIVDQTAVDPKAVGGTKYQSENTTAGPQLPCNAVLATPRVAQHLWLFDTGAKISSQGTFAYHPDLATVGIEGVRSELAKCTAIWKYGTTFDMKAIGAFTVVKPAGFDNSVGFCHEATQLAGASKGKKAFICDAFVSRGHLMARVSGVGLQKAAAQDAVAKSVPAVAAAIVKAQPAV